MILTRYGELRATIAELTEEVRLVATEGTLMQPDATFWKPRRNQSVLGDQRCRRCKVGLNRTALLSKMQKLGISPLETTRWPSLRILVAAFLAICAGHEFLVL